MIGNYLVRQLSFSGTIFFERVCEMMKRDFWRSSSFVGLIFFKGPFQSDNPGFQRGFPLSLFPKRGCHCPHFLGLSGPGNLNPGSTLREFGPIPKPWSPPQKKREGTQKQNNTTQNNGPLGRKRACFIRRFSHKQAASNALLSHARQTNYWYSQEPGP